MVIDKSPKPLEGLTHWLPIERIPRGEHDGDFVVVDLLRKRWDPETDKFVFERVCDVRGTWNWREHHYEWPDYDHGRSRIVGYSPLPPIPTEFP